MKCTRSPRAVDRGRPQCPVSYPDNNSASRLFETIGPRTLVGFRTLAARTAFPFVLFFLLFGFSRSCFFLKFFPFPSNPFLFLSFQLELETQLIFYSSGRSNGDLTLKSRTAQVYFSPRSIPESIRLRALNSSFSADSCPIFSIKTSSSTSRKISAVTV